jgi:GDP-4-dehydro-6-deoxy-D-mannose reductase
LSEAGNGSRALVTGASGFVGRFLVAALRARGDCVFAFGGPNEKREGFVPLDLGDPESLRRAFELAEPTVVFHLAAQTFVPESFAAPLATYETNALGTARLAHAARAYAALAGKRPRVVFASSAEVYGERDPADFPLRERLDVRPANPYAASKAAAEAILLAEARSLGLNAVVARSFTHVGPGQSERFVTANFAGQLAAVARGGSPRVMVGNLDAARDLLDVRDVVDAYLALGADGEAGEIYNVCSGTAVKIRDLLRELVTIAHVPVEIREDPARMRPSDVPIFVGSSAKLQDRTGWRPRVPLARTLREIYAAALDRAGNPAAGS